MYGSIRARGWEFPCKKTASFVAPLGWTCLFTQVKCRCHLCETVASPRWSNKVIRLFSRLHPVDKIHIRKFCHFVCGGCCVDIDERYRRLPTGWEPLWMFFHSNWLIIRRILCGKNFIFHGQFRCVFHCLEEFFFDIDKISLFNAWIVFVPACLNCHLCNVNF